MRTMHIGRAIMLGAALALGGCGDCDAPAGPPPGEEENLAYLAQLEAAPYTIGVVRELGEYEIARFREKASGDTYAVFGAKDEAGLAVDIQRIKRTEAAGVTTTAEYQANGDRSFTRANGVRMDVRRQDNGKWLAEFRDPASGTSFRTTLDDPGSAAPTATVQPAALTAAAAASTANQILANVTTTNCGTVGDPLGQRVFVQFNDGAGGFLGRYPAQRTGNGTYQAAVPNPDKQAGVSLAFLKSALSATASQLAIACKVDNANPMALPAACGAISQQMALTGIGAPIAAEFLAVCESAVAIFKATCAIQRAINLPTPPAVGDSGVPVINKTEQFLIDALPDQILAPTLRAVVEGQPADAYGTAVELRPGDTAVNLTLDLFRLAVGDIVLTPPAPAAHNQYTASAQLQCLAPGTNATLAVQGSDGYVNQQQQSYASVTNAATIALVVPGADTAGIRDTLTLTVTPPNAQAVTRTAYLVFQ